MKTLGADEINAAMLRISTDSLAVAANLMATYDKHYSVISRFIDRFGMNVDLPKEERGFLRVTVFTIWALLYYNDIKPPVPEMDALMEAEIKNFDALRQILKTDQKNFGDKLAEGHPQPMLVQFIIITVINPQIEINIDHKGVFIAELKCVLDCLCGITP